MLERYYSKPRTLDRIRALWLGPAIDQYVNWLTDRQAARVTVIRSVQILIRFNQYARSCEASTWSDLPALLFPFVDQWVQTHSGWCKSAKDRACVRATARVPIEQMLKLILPEFKIDKPCDPLPFEASVPGFFPHLHDERGLRPDTIRRYKYDLGVFESYLSQAGVDDFSLITPELINEFMIDCAKRLSPLTVCGYGSALRTFFRYLYRQEKINTDLARAVPRGRRYRQSSIPRSITWDDVQRVLNVIDRRDAQGKRDYAILLLLTSYGLRAKEVAALRLDDIDWKQNQLHITGRKGGHSTLYPLSTSVGQAIIDYLQCARPQVNYRDLFLINKSPYTPISHYCVSQRASHYINAVGIKVRRAGSHTFRHSCVQRLVNADIPFKIIGDYVGHRTPESTQIYGKVALHKLRPLAMGEEEIL